MRAAFLAWTLLVTSIATGETGVKMPGGLHLKAGDVIAQKDDSGRWAAIKVLLVDVWQFAEGISKFPEHASQFAKFRDLARNKVANF